MKVKLTYFKPSGKYYSAVEMNTELEFHGFIRYMRAMLEAGNNPGLVAGAVLHGEYLTLVECSDADGPWPPHLIIL